MSNETAASRLKMARFLAGYQSAKSFADQHQLSYITYSQHEAGKRGLNAKTAIKYCQLLEINLEWLLTGEGSGPSTSATTTSSKPTELSVQSADASLHPYRVAAETSHYQVTRKVIDKTLLLAIFDKLQLMVGDEDVKLAARDLITMSVDIYEDIISKDAQATEVPRLIELSIAAVRLGLLSRVE